MSASVLSSYSVSAPLDGAARQAREWKRDSSVVHALQVMVRRVLRTQDGRPGFRARVLEQARILKDNQENAYERDAFERLIVDQLLRACSNNRFPFNPQEKMPTCPSTWERVVEATIWAMVPPSGNRRPCQKDAPNDPRLHPSHSSC